MKIGTFLNQIERAVAIGEIPSIETGLKRLADKGLSYVDVTSEMAETYSVPQINAWLEPLELTVGSYIHCLPFRTLDESSWEFYKQDTALQLDRCRRLGCSLFMLVPEVDETVSHSVSRNMLRNQIVTYAHYVTAQSLHCNIHTLIENYSRLYCPFSTLEDLDYILKELPDLHFLLDTGNFWFNDIDTEFAVRKYAVKTAHVHLKDLSYSEQGCLSINGKRANSVALGHGMLPIKSSISILKQNGYDGGLSIELNSNVSIMSSLEASLFYLKEIGVTA